MQHYEDTMFGDYKLPLKIENELVQIEVLKELDSYSYCRKSEGETVSKLLLADQSKVVINPVEPLFTPKNITSFLLIEFDRTISVKPGMNHKIFITFPVEIGVFVSKKRDYELLDVFSFSKQKFTLYGDPSNGTICKHWKSQIFMSRPEVNPLYEGVIELTIRNNTTTWVSMNRALFKALGMKIYYNENLVAMRALMKLAEEEIAETEFQKSPLEANMRKSLELVTMKKLSVTSPKTVMMEGF